MTGCLLAAVLTLVDFTQPGHGWSGRNHASSGYTDPSGLVVPYDGEDPWIVGPFLRPPYVGAKGRLIISLTAETSFNAFTLYYRSPSEVFSESRRVLLRKSASGTYRALLPPLGDKTFFRIDPPGGRGTAVLRSLSAEPLEPLYQTSFPQFDQLPRDLNTNDALRLTSGALSLIHQRNRWDTFDFFWDGRLMSESRDPVPWAVRTVRGVCEFVPAVTAVKTMSGTNGFSIVARACDTDGVVWNFTRHFVAVNGIVTIRTRLTVSADRDLLQAPWLTLFSGIGTFGIHKTQALLPGVEFLAEEPSSNELEIRGPEANRRFVAPHKLCLPLAAVAGGGGWVSAVCDKSTLPVSPLFDSPDRLFHSGGHVAGFWSPSVGGETRLDSVFAVYKPTILRAGSVYETAFSLTGGSGERIVSALEEVVARRGLPPLPEPRGGFDEAVKLLAAGWLSSHAQGPDGVSWRHAVGGASFPPIHAEEVPVYLLWLASRTKDADLRRRLTERADRVTASFAGASSVGHLSHIFRPVGILVGDGAEKRISGAANAVRNGLKTLMDAAPPYRPGRVDYSEGSGTNVFNGFTAMCLQGVCDSVVLTGDEQAHAAYLRVLDRMTERFAGEVPRGAQPWEMPLHTPDIVAAGHLVRVYTLGYLLSGQIRFLEQARYWAWTGLSMVYLTPPASGSIGVYSTTGVLGATNWRAPNWIGLPVQWCGLVYAAALNGLAAAEPDARSAQRWRQVAAGITRAGVQMTYPIEDRDGLGGLLPDSFDLCGQTRNGPAINPGTVQMCLGEAYGEIPVYSLTRLSCGALVHVPGSAERLSAAEGTQAFRVRGWPLRPFRVAVAGLSAPVSVTDSNGAALAHVYLPTARALVITLSGSDTKVYIRLR